MSMFSFKKYNIADWFSFYRIISVPFLLIMIWAQQRQIFCWLLLVSLGTDVIDGFLARQLKISSERGTKLDSLGDQLTLAVSLIGVWVFEKEFVIENYILIGISIALYFVQMILAYSKYGKATSFHTYLAKMTGVIQGIFILVLLFYGPVYWLFYVTIIIGLIELIEEIVLIFMYKNWTSNVKGIYWALKDKRRQSQAI